MAIFRFFLRWRPTTILDFLKLKILTAIRWTGPVCVTMPSSAAIGPTIMEITAIYQFLNMAAVRHLSFVVRVFGPAAKTI